MPSLKKNPLTAIQKELRKHSTAAGKKSSEWFFKTGEGQYGHGDEFIGVTTPNIRKVAKSNAETTLSEMQTLLDSHIHEDRSLALAIARIQYEKAIKAEELPRQRELFNFFWRNKKRINNWDLVDASAPYISGHFAYIDPSARAKVFDLIHSKSLWDRRIAMISTFYFIRQGDFHPVTDLARALLKDKEDLMHKAAGWMLREMGKRDLSPLRDFLDHHAHEMPRTMLRYSLEKLGEIERKRYMVMKPR